MAETPANAQQSEETSAQILDNNICLVKERFEIYFDSPLPELDANGAVAYVAKDKINPQRELFALVCDNNVPPRLSVLPYLKSIDHPNILKLVEYSIIDYLPQKTMNMALIYNRPTGPKVSDFTPADKLTVEKFKTLAMSLVSAFETLKSYNITHRAIRLNNLFYKDAEGSELVLGDCAATFPALYQPDIYETIESLLCLPQGRGNGETSDDIYAAGVALLSIVLQHEPESSLATPEYARLKLTKGSLAALVNGERINSQFSPVIKGMLDDSSETRWSSIQLFNFLDGKTGTFSASENQERSIRALTVAGEKFYTPKSAALALYNHPEDAITVIKNGKLVEWIKNGLENEKLCAKIEKIIQIAKEQDSNRLLIPQICICLDHTLPSKCGDIYFFPNGVAKALFYYTKNHLSVEDFCSVLSSDIIKYWYQEQPYAHAPAGSSEFRVYLARNDYGYGLDRIMYDFDEDLPCISELVGKEFVNSPSKLLRALDNAYAANKERLPFDRNIVAYLRCKMGKKIDGILTDINAHQEALQIAAVIRLYANIQNKNGPVQLLNLTHWLIKSSRPVIETYHNIKYRKYLEQELSKLAKNGRIIDLYEILENDEARTKDRTDYTEALKRINLLLTERNLLLSGSKKLDEEARNLAIKFGSMLSILTMLASLIFSIIYWIIK